MAVEVAFVMASLTAFGPDFDSFEPDLDSLKLGFDSFVPSIEGAI